MSEKDAATLCSFAALRATDSVDEESACFLDAMRALLHVAALRFGFDERQFGSGSLCLHLSAASFGAFRSALSSAEKSKRQQQVGLTLG